jgi:hypothetical protein
MAYNSFDPIGNERFDYLFGRLAYVLVSALYPNAKDLDFKDFMPQYGPEASAEESNTQDLMTAKVMSMFARMGGRPRPKGR